VSPKWLWQVLRLLSCVVRHALPLGDLNSAGLRSLPMHLQLTLLIGQLHPSMNRMLSISTYPEAYLSCRDGLIDLYCAKVVYAGTSVADGFHGDAILKINLEPSYGRLPVIDPGTTANDCGIFSAAVARLPPQVCREGARLRFRRTDIPVKPENPRPDLGFLYRRCTRSAGRRSSGSRSSTRTPASEPLGRSAMRCPRSPTRPLPQ
jgi:hypothetical protein